VFPQKPYHIVGYGAELCTTANDPTETSKWVDVVEKGLVIFGEQ